MNNQQKLYKLQHGSCIPENFLEDRYQHCRERFMERFNLDMTYEEWQELNLRIFLDGEGVEWLDVGEGTNTSLIIVEAFGNTMLVAFSETAYCMMTVFPRSDVRLLHARNNRYTAKAISTGMLAYRDARRELADRIDELREDGFGRLVMPKRVEPVVEEPKPANVFAEALAGFKPAPMRNILTLPVPAAKEEVPVLDPEVVAAFAALSKQLSEAEEAVDATADVEARILDLERQIAALRARSPLADAQRALINAHRSMSEDAFAKFRDGIFDRTAALTMVGMMTFANDNSAPEESSEEVEASSGRMSRDGWAFNLPDAKCEQEGRTYFFIMDGLRLTLDQWGERGGVHKATIIHRAKQGYSFRESVYTDSVNRRA